MEKSEFDRLGKKFVNSTCTDKEVRNAELCFYLLPDENFISTKTLVRNKIFAKSKMSKEEFVRLLSTLGKMVAVLMGDRQWWPVFYGHKIAANGSCKNIN